jgi:lipopolysaccharide transport system permease protein
MGYIIEMARFLLLNEGNISQFGIIYTGVFSILIFLLGIVIFNKTEKTFIDTI